MLALLLQHNKPFKGLLGEEIMITIALLPAAYVLGISSDTLRALGENFKEQHERINKVSR